MMQPESIVKLAGSGNTRTVEEEWMRVMESSDAPVSDLPGYAQVLTDLRQSGRAAQAEALAWAAIETISSRHSPKDTLAVAGPFLLAVGNCADVRRQVAELYRRAYSDRDGLEELLREAGLEGGRPVRRALRTLEVCLRVGEGDFLSARDEDGAARIESIDTSSWEFTVSVSGGTESLDAVHLADRYRRADATDFNVMRNFAAEELTQRLRKDPTTVVIDICKQRGNRITSDELRKLVVPEFFTEEEWKKWWTRTRTALKRNPHIELTGRAPYTISYVEERAGSEGSFLEMFDGLHRPTAQLEALEKYVRECKARGESPQDAVIRHCFHSFSERAAKTATTNVAKAGLLWAIACRAAHLGNIEDGTRGADGFFRANPDSISDVISLIETDVLTDVVCECLVRARPDDWKERMLSLLPRLPMNSCDQAAVRLIEAGQDPAGFESVVQRIVAAPRDGFEALLWLWNGPTNETDIVTIPPVTVLMRILRTLNDARLSDEVDKEVVRKMSARARAMLSAKKYARFESCLENLDPAMAGPLRNQLLRNDALGRAVREDMLRRLSSRFPSLDAPEKIASWANEEILYVTQAGLMRKQANIEQHINVKMKENARAIGAAAEKGDLSENSEYKFALEERDLLRSRLAQMNSEVEKAKVLTEADISTDHLGIGTRAVFIRRSDGRRFEMTFLGPWEAETDPGIYNYQAPLAQKLMGKKVGDVVQFDLGDEVGEYELTELHNALAD